jgi:hypothetical protein
MTQLDGLCAEDPPARAAIAQQQEADHPKGRHHDNIMMSQGTSEGYALKRLHRERPDLHARVVAGELKANTAMVQAGLRPRTLTVKPGDPSSVARSLQRNMTAEDIATLVQLLKEPDQGGILGG